MYIIVSMYHSNFVKREPRLMPFGRRKDWGGYFDWQYWESCIRYSYETEKVARRWAEYYIKNNKASKSVKFGYVIVPITMTENRLFVDVEKTKQDATNAYNIMIRERKIKAHLS